MSEAADMPERVARVESWIEGHENLCAERFGSIRDTQKLLVGLMITTMLAVLGWLAVQLWNTRDAEVKALRAQVEAQAPA